MITHPTPDLAGLCERLRELRIILKSGDYDGADLMRAWCAMIDAAAAIERLVADAARLDWLDEVNRRTNERNGTTYGWRYDINHNRAALTDHNHPALSVRDAIDVARGMTTETEARLRVSERARTALEGASDDR